MDGALVIYFHLLHLQLFCVMVITQLNTKDSYSLRQCSHCEHEALTAAKPGVAALSVNSPLTVKRGPILVLGPKWFPRTNASQYPLCTFGHHATIMGAFI